MKRLISSIIVAVVVGLGSAERSWADPQEVCTENPFGDFPWWYDYNDTAGGSDPVSMASGHFTMNKTDLSVPGLIPITFTRLYESSVHFIGGSIGWTWDHSLNRYIIIGGPYTKNLLYHRDGRDIPLFYDGEPASRIVRQGAERF